ncbi:MAG: HK97 family phage prohead protease [Deltaproteobacteria bacterium]|nr:HK97 family phage prohead protease [Deltaproteobacteria bacterium]
MDLKHKALPISIKQGDQDTLIFTISTRTQDRDEDILEPNGCRLDNYMKNPVVLFAHDYRSLPIGRSKSVSVTADAVVAEVEFAPTQFAQEVKQLCQAGFLKAASVGFIPLKYEPLGSGSWGHRIYEWELLEWSIVPVPSNPTALISEAKAKGLHVAAIEEALEKGAISFGQAHPDGTPKAPEDEEWDGAAEVAAADVDDLKVMCAWVDSENADNKGAYKLAHHKASGNHAVVWRGVVAAMASLLGARGGVDIPDGDRKAVYNHLAKHYAEFDKEPPEFHNADDIITAYAEGKPKAKSEPNQKAGAVLSTKNKDRLTQARDLINEVLAEAGEGQDDEPKGIFVRVAADQVVDQASLAEAVAGEIAKRLKDVLSENQDNAPVVIDLDAIQLPAAAKSDDQELNVEPEILKELLKNVVKEELDRVRGRVS